MSQPNKEEVRIRLLMGPVLTGAGKWVVWHLSISLNEDKAGGRMTHADGRPNQRFVDKTLFYKTERMARRMKARAVEKGWSDFYSANLCMN